MIARDAPGSAAISCYLFALCACAATPRATAAEPTPALTSRSRIDALAPDFAARVRLAEHDAALARTPEARADQLRRATLLARAAAAESDRIELERAYAEYERRIAVATRARAEAERAAAAAAAALQLTAAAEQERAEAEWAFAALGRDAHAPAAERDRLSSFLLRRTQALLAAALALGHDTDDELSDAAALQLTAAGSAGLGTRVAASAQALLAATRALGAARLRAGPVRPAQTRDLLERLHERGFDAALSAEGTVLEIPAAFSPGGRDPRPELQRRLQLLRELLPGFPHGSIAVACGGEDRSAPVLASQRSERVVASLAVTTDRSRLTTASAPIAAHALRLVWTAYALQPQRPDVAP